MKAALVWQSLFGEGRSSVAVQFKPVLMGGSDGEHRAVAGRCAMLAGYGTYGRRCTGTRTIGNGAVSGL